MVSPKKSQSGLKTMIIWSVFAFMLAGLACSLEKTPFSLLKDYTSPLRVEITEPANGSSFIEGERITFRGEFEKESNCSNAYWTSSLDGTISHQDPDPFTRCASSMEFDTSNLSVGKHTIIYRVKDDNGTVSERITITIQARDSDSQRSQTEDFDEIKLVVESDRSETIDELIASQVLARVKGKCPAVDEEYAWAVEGRDECQWQVYHDISSFNLEIILLPDIDHPRLDIDLVGDLDLRDLYDQGESGTGEVTASGSLMVADFSQTTPGEYMLKALLPLQITAEGDYIQLHTSGGYNVFYNGGMDLSVDTIFTMNTANRRVEIRFEGYPLDYPTGSGDGYTIEALEIDLVFTWEEGSLTTP